MSDIRLKEKYTKEIVPELKNSLGYKNNLSVPRLVKIVVNSGLGRMSQQPNFSDRLLPESIKEFSLVVGRKPKTNPAKKSIAGFKMRQGQVVGISATLRRKMMYDFLEKMIRIVFPRVRDFRGVDLKNIDRNGNLSIGFRDHLVFPEVAPENSKADFGIEITIVTNAKNRDEAIALYRALGIPLKK